MALDRAPHVQASGELLDRLERGPWRTFVAWNTLSTLYYLLRPGRPGEDVRAFLAALTAFARVAPTDTEAFHLAVTLPLPDLEDAMQVAAARACGARWIATRNTGDFNGSPIPARTPAELLLELK